MIGARICAGGWCSGGGGGGKGGLFVVFDRAMNEREGLQDGCD